MNHFAPEFIEKLKAIRERVPRDVWLALAAGYRETSNAPNLPPTPPIETSHDWPSVSPAQHNDGLKSTIPNSNVFDMPSDYQDSGR